MALKSNLLYALLLGVLCSAMVITSQANAANAMLPFSSQSFNNQLPLQLVDPSATRIPEAVKVVMALTGELYIEEQRYSPAEVARLARKADAESPQINLYVDRNMSTDKMLAMISELEKHNVRVILAMQ
ncbi:MAG: hypothetical protein HWE13_12525 [Gammaproteobacteria bacterium]|nr:hypothetical protein [Gammaproteobacteria bacterium]